MGVRLPTILGKAIDDTVKTLNDQSDEEKILDLVACIDRMEDLMEDLQNNQKLRPIKDDGEGDIPLWNKEIARFFRGKDFMNAPWLFAEAYKYRRSVGRLGALSFRSVTFPVFSFVLIEFVFVLGVGRWRCVSGCVTGIGCTSVSASPGSGVTMTSFSVRRCVAITL